uniref:CCHC-type domain-containing protein n=1 Tax=Salix viminalis TaxID=40686 RepID=A0A6N2LZK8_SALVM
MLSEILCHETNEVSTEEEDLLTRSSKKVKIGDNNGQSYVEKLMGESSVTHEMDEDNLPNDCISEDEDDDADEDDCPVIKISSEEKKRIRAPWKQTLIIKLMGRKVGYMFFMQRLRNMWKLRGDFTLTDLGNEFYLAKFANPEDREHVLFGGPWMVTDHYLTIRTWHPNFDPFEATIDKVAVWVRLPELALEYYDTAVLWKIGDKIGKTLKIDRTTSVGMRGNFARLCVEVDLTKPLLAKFKLRRRVRRIMYEGLHSICFHCGQYGHKQELCPQIPHENKDHSSEKEKTEVQEVPIIRPEIMESFGSWMVAERRQRRPNKRTVMEENNRNGKGGVTAVNSGKTLMTVTGKQVNVSARFDALMALQEETADKRAGERGEEIKEKEDAGGSTFIPRAGRLTGHKKERASGGQGDKQGPRIRSPNAGGPKLAADESNTPSPDENNTPGPEESNIPGPESSAPLSVKGKEKMEEVCTGIRGNGNHSAMLKPRKTNSKVNMSYKEQRPQVQHREYHTDHERFRNVTTRTQQFQENAHRPEPPDKENGGKMGTEIGDKEGFMEVESETAEEMMVDGGIALTEHAC